MHKYHYVTSVSAYTFWVREFVCNDSNKGSFYSNLATKYGETSIFINKAGGWMTRDSIDTIHQTVEAESFPSFIPEIK